MTRTLKLGSITVDVTFKDIRNVHLSVNPPDGTVRVSAPAHMNPEAVRLFAISRLDWIRQQQKKLREQERESDREYIDRESHYVWGKRYLLKVEEADDPPFVQLQHSRMLLSVRPGADLEKREAIVQAWYRKQVQAAVPKLLAKWQPRLKVEARGFYVRRMKTKWGSCNHVAQTIRLNTELAKKPRECLEYIVVHELAHLLQPTHNTRFFVLMDRHMPRWQFYRQLLNRLPVRRENWDY